MRAHARRALDVAARYGGEEFALILPGMNGAEAAALAEDVRRVFELAAIEHAGVARSDVVTVSAGVAAQVPARNANRFDLLGAADAALYTAKARGKNMVVLA